MEHVVIGVAAVVGLVVLLAFAVSNRVGYRESITVDAPPEQVFRAVLFQEELMAWSAWPAATNSTCRVVGTDGQVGATVEYITKGKVAGTQTVAEVAPGERVVITLTDPSPFGQKPVVTFHVRPGAAGGTEVALEFANTIRRPFQLLLKGAGIVRWVRELHRKDLAGLKAFCERQPVPA